MFSNLKRFTALSVLLAVLEGGSDLAWAQALPPEPPPSETTGEPDQVDEVVVSVDRASRLSLDSDPHTGSRLNLSARETPAVIDVLTQRDVQDLGARSTEEALNRMPGVSSTGNATSPGSLSLRGFTGSGRAVLLLFDGVRPAEESFFTRVMDSWLFERVEVLQGPASVDYGEGALAGVVNLVPKRAQLDRSALSGQVGYGSFGSFRAAGDANVTVVDELAVRPVISYGRSSGYVDGTASEFLAGTVGMTWAPSKDLTVQLAVDYLRDDYDVAYFGTPLVPPDAARSPSDLVQSADGRVLDTALRDANYNVEDGVTDSTTGWLRSDVDWQLGGGWSLSNDLHLYTSERSFINSEYFGYNAETGLVDRSTGIVTQDFGYWIERLTLRGDSSIGRLRNRVAAGASYSAVDFFTERRFGSTTSVQSLQPERGQFPIGDDASLFGRREDRDNTVDTASVFLEDALNVTPSWILLAGVRYDRISVDRVSTDLVSEPPVDTPTVRDFDVVTARLGTTIDLLPKLQLFGQYSTAAAPPSSLLALSPAGADFEMTRGRALEGGGKGSPFGDRVELQASVFYIEQTDIVTRSRNDPSVSVQGGKQSSRGVELSLSASPVPQLRLVFNQTLLDARFDSLIDDTGADLAGNTPARVPEHVLNAFAFWDVPGLPLMASVGAHHAGRFFTDAANTFEVGGYTTLEAALRARLELGKSDAELTVRGRNLTNALYAGYTDISPDQLHLGAPRSVDAMLTVLY